MAHRILINGRYLSPERAASERLPLDTPLACPECNGRHVEAKMALTMEQLGGDLRTETPRYQDRRCLECGHRWQAVLPPELYHDPRFAAHHTSHDSHVSFPTHALPLFHK